MPSKSRYPRLTHEQRIQRVVDAVKALGGRAATANVADHVGVHPSVVLYELKGAAKSGLLAMEKYGRKHIYVLPRRSVEKTAPVIAVRIMEELKCDMNACAVPEDVASFEELHDHVDANLYGLEFAQEMLGIDGITEELVEYMNAAQAIVGEALAEVRRQALAEKEEAR